MLRVVGEASSQQFEELEEAGLREPAEHVRRHFGLP
jgi:hypothetical protein